MAQATPAMAGALNTRPRWVARQPTIHAGEGLEGAHVRHLARFCSAGAGGGGDDGTAYRLAAEPFRKT